MFWLFKKLSNTVEELPEAMTHSTKLPEAMT